MIPTPQGSFSLIKWLVLMLALMDSVHGKSVTSKKIKDSPGAEQQPDECPIHEDSKFPNSVRVQIHVAHTNRSNTVPRDVRKRSVSPWEIRINEDPNRFPYAIAEANCLYNACVDASGRGLNYGMSSVPIQQEILVLKRKPTRCQQTYWLEKQLVTVGCTCAFSTTNTYHRRTDATTKTQQ